MPTIRIDTDHIIDFATTLVAKTSGLTVQHVGGVSCTNPALYKQAIHDMSAQATENLLAHRLPERSESEQSSNENFPIRIGQGVTQIEYIHGRVTPEWFQIYVGLSSDHCWVENSCEGAATNVLVYPDGSKVWDEDTGTMMPALEYMKNPTVIELPPNWQIGLSENKGVLRIIGVRYPEDTADISQDVPFTVCTPAEFGY